MKMKLMTTTVAALAVAAALQTVAKGEDPMDPQPGAKVSVYSTQKNFEAGERFEAVTSGAFVPLSVSIDSRTAFTLDEVEEDDANYDADTVVWEGFLLSKTAGQFTFTASHSSGIEVHLYYRNGNNIYLEPANQFAIQINGQTLAGNGNQSFNVNLNAGFNTIKIMANMWTGGTPKFTLAYKPANSTVTPRPITPKLLFHEEEISDEDW